MTLRRDWDSIRRIIGAVEDEEEARAFIPHCNIAPQSRHPLVRLEAEQRRLRHATWGMQRVPGERPLLHARAETLGERALFAEALAARRCVLPVDGFFETDRQTRQPFWFHLAGDALFFLAGLWSADADGARFVVITTAPNARVAQVHDRMPAVLSAAEAAAWLDGPDTALLRPAPEPLLDGWPVSDRVYKPLVDDAELLQPVKLRPRQLTLF